MSNKNAVQMVIDAKRDAEANIICGFEINASHDFKKTIQRKLANENRKSTMSKIAKAKRQSVDDIKKQNIERYRKNAEQNADFEITIFDGLNINPNANDAEFEYTVDGLIGKILKPNFESGLLTIDDLGIIDAKRADIK